LTQYSFQNLRDLNLLKIKDYYLHTHFDTTSTIMIHARSAPHLLHDGFRFVIFHIELNLQDQVCVKNNQPHLNFANKL